ncbi:hypothetical protein [Salinarimonas chemoclinalis]|uniref:hypothetical protein n=1 Tax=Salinarimonas chemoclinalis TaxID=3241599 RepID=UPI0035564FC8
MTDLARIEAREGHSRSDAPQDDGFADVLGNETPPPEPPPEPPPTRVAPGDAPPAPVGTEPAPGAATLVPEPGPVATPDYPTNPLVVDIADWLVTGDAQAIQDYAGLGYVDPFFIAISVAEADAWIQRRTFVPDGEARAETATETRAALETGTGPVTFAIRLEDELRAEGIIPEGARVGGVMQVRVLYHEATPETQERIRAAVARAQADAGLPPERDLGVFAPPPATLGELAEEALSDLRDFIQHEVLEPLGDFADLARTGSSVTVGWLLPTWSPVQGVVMVVSPIDGNGLSDVFDFTTTDGDPSNPILGNFVVSPGIGRRNSGRFPGDRLSFTLALGVELETANIGTGENVITRLEWGPGLTQGAMLEDIPFLRDRFPAGTIVANIRGGFTTTEDGQVVISANLAINLGLDQIVAGGLTAGSGIAAALGGWAITGAGLRGAASVDRLGQLARNTIGMPTLGIGWRVEYRFDGDAFLGVYSGDQRLDSLSRSVDAALQAEARARGTTIGELVESGRATGAIARGMGFG